MWNHKKGIFGPGGSAEIKPRLRRTLRLKVQYPAIEPHRSNRGTQAYAYKLFGCCGDTSAVVVQALLLLLLIGRAEEYNPEDQELESRAFP